MKLIAESQITGTVDPQSIITTILEGRGILPTEVAAFLTPPLTSHIFLESLGVKRKEITKAFKRLRQALEGKEQVVIYGDYDVDGVTSSTILYQIMLQLGFNVQVYLPNRFTDGYGLSKEALKKIKALYSPTLLITVDHGIKGESYIKELQADGVDTIIIDHHQEGEVYPESAIAVIYNKKLSASGLAYLFAKELYLEISHKPLDKKTQRNLLVMGGIGVIADVMNLQHEARSLAYYALRELPKSDNLGLKALLQSSGLGERTAFGSYDVGFVIGPRINSAGRLQEAIIAFNLLNATNETVAKELAKELEALNKLRQKKLETQLTEALKIAEKIKDNVIFLWHESFDEGLVGLLAAKVADKFKRPTLVATLKENLLKGSARSVENFDITQFLSHFSKSLRSFGGHSQAAGFSLLKENLVEFTSNVSRKSREVLSILAKTEKILRADVGMSFANLNLKLCHLLNSLEPFGEGNLKPLFLTRGVEVVSARPVGKTGDHYQLFLKDASSKNAIKCVFFKSAVRMETIDINKPIDVLYALEIDSWRGEVPSLHIREIVQSE